MQRNLEIGKQWADAWNSHDAERIVALYDEGATHQSPGVRLFGSSNEKGELVGRSLIRAHFERALKRFPQIHFEIRNTIVGERHLVIEYLERTTPSGSGKRVAEILEIRDGRIIASRVYLQ